MTITFRISSPSDRAGVLAVLAASRGEGLSPQERAEQGFVQGAFTEETLARVEAGPGVVIGVDAAGAVVAVAMTMTQTLAGGPPASLALYMRRHHGDKRWAMYGPVAVAPSHRGRGLMRPLLTEVSRRLAGYELAAGFIDADNAKSMAVHTAVGMTVDGEFTVNARRFTVVTFRPGEDFSLR
ncbi:GNAT family N-acetyltransferase [Corynebacterium sp.]|uniref:GNAT family N-acetyltransferase n=1 Tax=Corynebacterium sp. TaxID=1720 RepID=UPI0037365B2C